MSQSTPGKQQAVCGGLLAWRRAMLSSAQGEWGCRVRAGPEGSGREEAEATISCILHRVVAGSLAHSVQSSCVSSWDRVAHVPGERGVVPAWAQAFVTAELVPQDSASQQTVALSLVMCRPN